MSTNNSKAIRDINNIISLNNEIYQLHNSVSEILKMSNKKSKQLKLMLSKYKLEHEDLFLTQKDLLNNIDTNQNTDVDTNDNTDIDSDITTRDNTDIDSDIDSDITTRDNTDIDSDVDTINEFASNYAEQIIKLSVESVQRKNYTENDIAKVVQMAQDADFAA